MGRASKKRLYADVWSKLQFQFAARRTPITIQLLGAAATHSCVAAGSGNAVVSATGVEATATGPPTMAIEEPSVPSDDVAPDLDMA